MKTPLKKRGQKFIKRFFKLSQQAGAEGKQHIKRNFFNRFSHIRSIRLLIFEWILLIIALIMFAISQSLWFQDSYSLKTFADGNNFTEATLGKINSLNPLFATTNSEKALSRLLFSTLTSIDRSGHYNLNLADSVTTKDDGKTWLVKLKSDLRWSDGHPITNADVIFTAKLIQNPAVDSAYRANLQNIKVSETENQEIVFALPSPYTDFMFALDFPILPTHILKDVNPKQLLEHDFSTKPTTSGPFLFKIIQTVSQEGEKIAHLSKNPHFHREKPLLDNFAIHAYLDKTKLIAGLNSGQATATAELSLADQKALSSQDIQAESPNLNSGTFIFFNTQKDPLKNPALRTAIKTGIDLEKLRAISQDSTALDYPILTSNFPLTRYPASQPRDIQKSLQSIKAHLNESTTPINIVTINSSPLKATAEALSEELQALGLKTTLSIYEESSDFTTNIISRRNYDILIYTIELGADPDPFPYYHSSQTKATGLNLSNYQNPIVDDLLLGARQTMNTQLRTKKYESFLDYWTIDAPAIGLFQTNLNYFFHKNVRTINRHHHLVTPLDRFNSVSSWSVTQKTKKLTP